MEKKPNLKNSKKIIKKTKQQAIIAEFSEIGQKREKELQELDRIAKMLVKRDLELSEIREKREAELKELEKRAEDLEDSRRALMNILEDVEDARKMSEEEKNKTLTIISNLTDGLLVFDKNNNLSLINPQAGILLNVKPEEITGNPISELGKFLNLQPLVNLLGKEIKGVFRKELKIKEDITLEISTIPMMSGDQELGTLVILHDITREKMVERIKTEFVSLAAHQLRTPLSAIKWTLDMLLNGDLGEITVEQKDFIGKTYQSNERMINLINDLLDVTRIEEGKYLYRPTLTDLGTIVQFVMNSCKEEVQRKKLNLEFKKPIPKLPKIILDVEKIRLVVQNLLENAIKYTPSGGKITVSLKHLKDKKEAELQVQDTGVGIPKDQQERVFTKFFRAANVMRLDTGGSGLGLFISKNIVEAHGGRIRFELEEGKGTTFYLNLPIKEEFVEFLKEF